MKWVGCSASEGLFIHKSVLGLVTFITVSCRESNVQAYQGSSVSYPTCEEKHRLLSIVHAYILLRTPIIQPSIS
jgi:hypothetical protein